MMSCEGVYFVEEYDGWCSCFGFLENLKNILVILIFYYLKERVFCIMEININELKLE